MAYPLIIINPENIPSYVIYAILFIASMLNVYGLEVMYKRDKKFCFEKYVLFSGLFELFLILLEMLLPDDLILSITQTIQIFQPLYITQKFMVDYVNLTYKHLEHTEANDLLIENKIKKYDNYFKVILPFIAILLISFALVEYFDQLESFIDDYFFFIHDGLCLIICIVLFILSINLTNLFEEHINSSNSSKKKPEAAQNLVEQTEKDILDKSQGNEVYLITRKRQILLISVTYLVIHGLQFIISFIEIFVPIFHNPKRESPGRTKKRILEKTLDIFEYSTNFLCLLNTISNFITFYFIIRDSYKLKYVPERKSQYLNNEDIEKNKIALQETKTAKSDVENFLDD